MPVYDQGYRSYAARAPLRRLRFWPITREALRSLAARKLVLVLLVVLVLAAWVPALAFLAYLYGVTQVPDLARQLPADGRVFGYFLQVQESFVFLMTIFAGAGLIANDLRTGGILIYLSRPLTLRDYLLGKLGALLALQLAVTLVPGVLLYLAALGLAPQLFARWQLAWIGPAVVLQSLLVTTTYSLVALALSSLVRSARAAGLLFFGGLTLLQFAAFVLRVTTRRPEALLLSPPALLNVVGSALFGVPERAHPHWGLALLLLALLAAAALFVLRARVRAVEVVQ
jgi:ABC-type transport system involved in multi-copper enzyme maturation permease subunit